MHIVEVSAGCKSRSECGRITTRKCVDNRPEPRICNLWAKSQRPLERKVENGRNGKHNHNFSCESVQQCSADFAYNQINHFDVPLFSLLGRSPNAPDRAPFDPRGLRRGSKQGLPSGPQVGGPRVEIIGFAISSTRS